MANFRHGDDNVGIARHGPSVGGPKCAVPLARRYHCQVVVHHGARGRSVIAEGDRDTTTALSSKLREYCVNFEREGSRRYLGTVLGVPGSNAR